MNLNTSPSQCLLRAHWYLAVICFPGRVSQTSDVDVCVTGHSVEYICDLSPPNPMSLFYRQESSEHNTTWSQTIGNVKRERWKEHDRVTTFYAFVYAPEYNVCKCCCCNHII